MSYKLNPLNNVLVVPLKPKETKEYTDKILADVETSKMNVLTYGRVMEFASTPNNGPQFMVGDVILYQKLASHNTNFGTPRQVLVPIEQIEGKLEEIVDAPDANQAA